MLKSAAKRTKAAKRPSQRHLEYSFKLPDSQWVIRQGVLEPVARRGRPPLADKIEHLFRVVGEKIPYEYLATIRDDMVVRKLERTGVYIAHDSMGCPRYVGRGAIFSRLLSHKKAHPLELQYFSFYVVAEKKHEREIESILIRAASFLLHFNDRKKRLGISAGSVLDFEPKTLFYERAIAK